MLHPSPHFLLNALPLLLHDHDCLVIPGMGGFVAHPVPARFDADKGEWIPQGRDVLFNPKLTVRDGLLEQEIRRATGCSTEAATEWLDREVRRHSATLQREEHVTLSGLGRLYRAEDGTDSDSSRNPASANATPPRFVPHPLARPCRRGGGTETEDHPNTGR